VQIRLTRHGTPLRVTFLSKSDCPQLQPQRSEDRAISLHGASETRESDILQNARIQMRPNEIPEIHPPLTLKVCPRCDYSLTGLPRVGNCPECGRAYDQIAVYLYGDAAGNRQTAWNRRLKKRSQLIWRTVFILPFCLFLSWQMFRSRMAMFGWIQIAQFTIPLAILFWRSFSDSGSGLVQVKLTPDGVCQGTRGLGPIPYEKVDERKLIAWKKIREIQLKPKGDGQAHIRMTSSNHWWQLTHEYVHAIVQCSPAELDALKQRIAQWRSLQSLEYENRN
jgi:hypothetical protein